MNGNYMGWSNYLCAHRILLFNPNFPQTMENTINTDILEETSGVWYRDGRTDWTGFCLVVTDCCHILFTCFPGSFPGDQYYSHPLLVAMRQTSTIREQNSLNKIKSENPTYFLCLTQSLCTCRRYQWVWSCAGKKTDLGVHLWPLYFPAMSLSHDVSLIKCDDSTVLAVLLWRLQERIAVNMIRMGAWQVLDKNRDSDTAILTQPLKGYGTPYMSQDLYSGEAESSFDNTFLFFFF